jgi:lysophospholipase L1-like esterase
MLVVLCALCGGIRLSDKEKTMRTFAVACVLCLSASMIFAAEEKLIDNMDDVALWKVGEKEQRALKVEAASDAKEGEGAVKISVGEGIYAITYRLFEPNAAWNDFDGIAFWLKGDGSENWGCIRIQAGNWNKAWLGNFPLKDSGWHEVKLAWKDLVPSSHTTPELGDAEGFKPGDVNLVSFGKSWNFTTKHTRPPISFEIDNLRIIEGVQSSRRRVSIDTFPPVADVVKKMKAGEPVTVLALGDSITWGTSVGGNANAYPAILGEMLRKHYANDKIIVVSRAIGGSTTAKGRQWLMRDVKGLQADLITVMFGFNEKPGKPEDRERMTKAFQQNLIAYLEEVAGVMEKPPAAVLLATIPGRDAHWDSLDCYAEGARELGKQHKNVAVADCNGFFKPMGKEKYATLMADGAHPNREGQREMAKVVFRTITGREPTQ